MHKTNYRPSLLQARLLENYIKEYFGWQDQIVRVHHVIEDLPYKSIIQIERRTGTNPEDCFFERIQLST